MEGRKHERRNMEGTHTKSVKHERQEREAVQLAGGEPRGVFPARVSALRRKAEFPPRTRKAGT